MKRLAIVPAAVALALALSQPSMSKEPDPRPRPVVQIAILLDTSNSMDGLIDQAKSQLWSIVNEFVRAKKDGRPPTVQVALFEYGKASLPPGEGFVRLILPLTDDLDRVSEELFKLKTNGGDEYCGWVIRDAVNRLEWSRSGDVYKGIFIAGNEPFTQGPVDFRAPCRAAIERGIVVNTIFCGPNSEGVATSWRDGATLADGRYMSIDQNMKVVDVATPQDKEIAKLGVDLNSTYIPYGRHGAEGQTRQAAQDANALSASPSALASRSYSKANAVYSNGAWDLVDAIKNGVTKLDDLKDDDLPADLRKLDKAARKAKVDEASRQRASMQAKINELNDQRRKFIESERRTHAKAKGDSLDQAIVKAIREQAARYRFTFE